MVVVDIKLSKKDIRRVRSIAKKTPQILFDEMRKAYIQDDAEWQKGMKGRFGGVGINRSGGSRPGGKLRVRSGALRRSLSGSVTGNGLSSLELRETSAGIAYARLQEYGGVVKPVSSKYLTIPIDDNLTPAGVARFPSARKLIQREGLGGKNKNNFVRGGIKKPKLRFLRTKSGNLFLVREHKGDVQFLFLLVKQVKIPPRLQFFKTWRDLEPKRLKRHKKALNRAMRRAKQEGRRG